MKKIHPNSYYTEDSEWIRKENNDYKIGISDFAQYIYGEITVVFLPELNSHHKKGNVVCHLESSKTLTEIQIPFDGKIIGINSLLISNPQLINESPYEKGWLFTIETKEENPLSELMESNTYAEYIGELFNKK